MPKLLTVATARRIEHEANANGFSSAQMMEIAGSGLAAVIEEEFGYLAEVGALGLIGPGNNGGDTLVTLYYLAKRGWHTAAYIIGKRSTKDALIARLQDTNCEIVYAGKDVGFHQLDELMLQKYVWLDGILGTGSKLPLSDEIGRLLNYIKQKVIEKKPPCHVIAVDCPTGVNCDTGEAAPETIAASMTVIMGDVKVGLLRFPAFKLLGDIRVIDIGIPKNLPTYQDIKDVVADTEQIKRILPTYPLAPYDDNLGKLLIIGGSVNYSGAAYLAGKAACRTGIGQVLMGVPDPLYEAMAGQFPEAIWLLLPHEMGVIAEGAVNLVQKNLEGVSALLLGPGLGEEDTTKDFVDQLLNTNSSSKRHGIGFVQSSPASKSGSPRLILPPMILDAGTMRLLEKLPYWAARLSAPAILIMEPRDMLKTAGMDADDILSDRLGISKRFAAEWEHVLVLTGMPSIIAAPDGQATVVPITTPALAKAGADYILAGIIAGLRAQGIASYPAAIAGTWMHAMAGKVAVDRLGGSAPVMASDILSAVPDVMRNLNLGKY